TAGDSLRLKLARLASSWTPPPCAAAGGVALPLCPRDALASAGSAEVIGGGAGSVREVRRNCGVCATMGYCVPGFGSVQKERVVCELPERDTSRSEATSVSVRPSNDALVRSTSTLSVG